MGFFEDRDDLGPPPDPFRVQRDGDGGDFQSPVPLKWIGVAAAVIVLLIALNVAKSIYVDFLWFDSVDFSGVYQRVIAARVILFLVGAVITAAVLGLNIWLARRLAPRGPEESFIEEVDPEAIRKLVTIMLVAATLFLAIVFGSVAAGAWETVLRWMNGVPFGRTDPQFGRDVSFYLFDLPAYNFLQGWFMALLVVSTLAAGAVYGLSISLQRFELNITRGMRIHLSILVGLILLLIALSTYLGIFDLLTSPGGIVFGATAADISARLPVQYILIALALFAGIATIANAFLSEQGFRLPLFAFGLWAIAGIVGGVIYPSVVQQFQIDPNERAREEPYIARNIDATRFAFGLDEIVETNFPAEQRVSEEELESNPGTLENVRLLDPRPLIDTINQIQAIRTLYRFNDVDVDRYVIDGELTQVMLSARELDLARVQERNWTRERLQLTHGFGAVVTPVNEVQPEGLPRLVTANIPPESDVLPISEEGSRVYFGELTNHYVIVDSQEPEFDYPVGQGNAEVFYGQDEGIELSSYVRRLALAWELGDLNLLISDRINNDSRILMHRMITERISKVAPFLVLDSDPYLVIDDGQLKWVQSAYTTGDAFPYSQPRAGVNYIRDSVKVVVDALTGETTFYLIDENDPVIQTWANIFPDLFTPQEEMPQSIRDHLRYPLDLFRVQSNLYLRYHIENPNDFFVGEDFWNVPVEQTIGQEVPIEPYYVLMTLPEEEQTEEDLEFALIMPFTPRERDNTIAWLAGRADGDRYGTMRAYRFPTDDLVYGPAQIEARIDQNPGISQQISLWNRTGSQVIRGNLLMIPIGESFLFVEPIYLQAEGASLPELVRVIVANGDSIAMETTFDRALDVLRGEREPSLAGTGVDPDVEGPPPEPAPDATGTPEVPGLPATPTPAATPTEEVPDTPTPPPGTPAAPGGVDDLIQQAREASDMTEAELERLRDLLDQIEQAVQDQQTAS